MSEESPEVLAVDVPRSRRVQLFLGATLEISGRSASGRIRNISSTGALLETSENLRIGETIVISFRGIDHMAAVIKRRTKKGFGINFVMEIDPSVCRLPTNSTQLKSSDEYILHLRETNRRPIWDNSDLSFKRPRLK